MALKNNLQRQDFRRQVESNYDDSPSHVNVKQSILDLRPLYPDMTDAQFSKWYHKRYKINAETVLLVITS